MNIFRFMTHHPAWILLCTTLLRWKTTKLGAVLPHCTAVQYTAIVWATGYNQGWNVSVNNTLDLFFVKQHFPVKSRDWSVSHGGKWWLNYPPYFRWWCRGSYCWARHEWHAGNSSRWASAPKSGQSRAVSASSRQCRARATTHLHHWCFIVFYHLF